MLYLRIFIALILFGCLGLKAREPEKVLVFGMYEAGSKFYRIPALCCTQAGTLIAVADKRGDDIADLPNTISVVMKRSLDGGSTWSDAVTLAQGDAAGGLTYGDPAVVYDPASGTILCVFVGDTGFFTSLDGSKRQGLYYVKSSDDGLTWTAPRAFTDQVWQPEWRAAFVASGSGLRCSDGRIMFVVNARTNPTPDISGVYEYVIYTDDLGDTWHLANSDSRVPRGGYGNESKLAELPDGRLLMSMRYGGTRRFAVSTDGGTTWSAPWSAAQLTEPADGGCNGDMISYTAADGRHLLLHSTAACRRERRDVSVYLSYDGGLTWPVSRRLIDGRSAYSALTVLPDGSIGCLVEEGWGAIGDMAPHDGFNLYFVRFPLEWLEEGA